MSQEVARLEELLARVQRNAALPRLLAVAPAAAAPVAAAPVLAAAPVVSAPSYTAPVPAFAPEPAAFVPEPAVFAPEPVFTPEPPVFESEPPAAVAQFNAPLDASVDDLLLEDPFPSVPAPAAPSYTDMLDEDPIPLVSVSSSSSAAHDDSVSGVMAVAEFSEEEPEELLEDDIVEMSSSIDSVVPAANPMDELNFDDDELDSEPSAPIEEPPASSSRSKIAGTMDEALARAAEQIQLEEGREVPLKTPPPESGPQAAMALPVGIHAPLAPDLDELLEADILPTGGVNAAVPTTEQLGQTIDLEEARGPSLELDHPSTVSNSEPPPQDLSGEELEVTLPQREYGGGYQDDLMPPPEARQELEAHRQRFGDDDSIPPPPESLAQYPSHPPDASSGGFAPVIVPANVSTDSYSESVSTVTVDAPANAEFAPELLARPDINPAPIAKFVRVEAPRPSTFLQLLDGSLSLGRD